MTTPDSGTAFGSENLKQAAAFSGDDETKELTTMSIAEALSAESDLRGITEGVAGMKLGSASVPSTQAPSAQAQAFSRLDDDMARLPLKRTAAYREALIKCPQFCGDERKLMFLEREDFDPKRAAARLALYWEKRLEFFGPNRCYLPMTLCGAMKEDVLPMAAWSFHQLLPVTDTAGRAIIYADPNRMNLDEYVVEQELRVMFYLCEVAAEDPNIRRDGYIVLGDVRHLQLKHFHRKLAECFTLMDMAFPLRGRGSHFCYPSAIAYYIIAPIVKQIAGRAMRLRFNMHHGSTEKVLRELNEFCLPKDRVPVELGGDLVLDMNKWVSDRLAKEQKAISIPLNLLSTTPTISKNSIAPANCLPSDGEDSSPCESVTWSTHICTPSPPPVMNTGCIGDVIEQTDVIGNRLERRDSFDDAICELPGLGEALHSVEPRLILPSITKEFSPKQQQPSRTTGIAKKGVQKGIKRYKGGWGRSDPRMDRAVQAKLANPKLSLDDALLNSGFVFDSKDDKGQVVDSDFITLRQRKNNLVRRIRKEKKAFVACGKGPAGMQYHRENATYAV